MQMKHFASLKYAPAILALAACGSVRADLLNCSLDSPTNGATFTLPCGGQAIALNATAYANVPIYQNGGGPTNTPTVYEKHPADVVYFYVNNVLIGYDDTPTATGFHFSIVWTNTIPGIYRLKAVADLPDNFKTSKTNT